MPKNKLLKQQEAKQREEARNKRSHKDQLNMLDSVFGKGLGAIKERARLNNIINKKEEPSEVDSNEVSKPKRKSKKKNEK